MTQIEKQKETGFFVLILFILMFILMQIKCFSNIVPFLASKIMFKYMLLNLYQVYIM